MVECVWECVLRIDYPVFTDSMVDGTEAGQIATLLDTELAKFDRLPAVKWTDFYI